MRLPLIIWGTGGHARVVADIVRCGSEFDVVGFLDDVNLDRTGQYFCDAPVLGGRDRLAGLRNEGVRHIVLGFGDNMARCARGRELVADGFVLARVTHPRATLASDVRLGAGTVVMAGAIVNPNVTVGENVIVNTGSTIDHDCILGDAVHLSPGAHLGGGVRVGDETWIGLGALVLDGRSVGKRSIVGAGGVVTRNLPDDVVAYGVPAKAIRPR